MSKIKLSIGDEIHGFRHKRSTPLPELSAVIHELEHVGTKARYLHFENSDDDNLFAIGFRTPPADSTGSPHILEHTVLCGSKAYPVRDPFFSMLKRSLNTFMNAMTASDWTLYPFSTCNRKDFYNLMRVYLDAVLFPLLKEEDFRQEGHRLEFENPADPTSPLSIKGVVYNEMKGAMSDPHSLLSARMDEIIYPTAAYGRNSGGDPKHIPDLTWQQLRNFHAACYHPSNSYIFSYGDMVLEDHLALIDKEFLSKFKAIDVKSTEVAREKRFSKPISAKKGCPLSEGESPSGKTMAHVAWLACDISDDVERLGLELLSNLLLGNPSTPLYKTLLDSKLGSNLTPGSGYNSEYRDTQFGAGLQNCEESDAPAVEELIMSTLRKTAEEGFPREKVDAAFQQLEFEHREVRGVHYPYSISLLIRIMGPWIHGADPVQSLMLDENLGTLRKRIESGPFLCELIRKHLLDNPHRATLFLVPDPELEKRESLELSEKLAKIKEGLSEEQTRELVEQAKALQAAQETVPDLSILPTVEIEDVPGESKSVDSVATTEAVGAATREFDQPTNGIGYFFSHLDLDGLSEEETACLPLFCSLLTQVGTAGKTYTEMAERIAAYTGGVNAGVAMLESPEELGKFRASVQFEGKALARFQTKLFEIIGDIFSSPDFKDFDRIHTVVNQIRTKLENSLPQQGHKYAAKAAAAMLTPAAGMWEKWTGIEYVRKVKSIAALSADDLGGAASVFESLAEKTLSTKAMECALVSEARNFSAMEPEAAAFVEKLSSLQPQPGSEKEPSVPDENFRSAILRLGFSANVPVSFVARVFPCVEFTHPDSPGLLVLSKLLRAEFLHREIREKGGAYGGMASYSAESGIFTLASYRDPHIVRTLDVYDQAAQWAVKGEFGKEEVKQAILGAVSDLDRPLSPSAKAAREFSFIRQGLTLEIRQSFREGVLSAEPEKLAELADKYLLKQRDGSSCAVISNQESLEKANTSLGSEKLEISRI